MHRTRIEMDIKRTTANMRWHRLRKSHDELYSAESKTKRPNDDNNDDDDGNNKRGHKSSTSSKLASKATTKSTPNFKLRFSGKAADKQAERLLTPRKRIAAARAAAEAARANDTTEEEDEDDDDHDHDDHDDHDNAASEQDDEDLIEHPKLDDAPAYRTRSKNLAVNKGKGKSKGKAAAPTITLTFNAVIAGDKKRKNPPSPAAESSARTAKRKFHSAPNLSLACQDTLYTASVSCIFMTRAWYAADTDRRAEEEQEGLRVQDGRYHQRRHTGIRQRGQRGRAGR